MSKIHIIAHHNCFLVVFLESRSRRWFATHEAQAFPTVLCGSWLVRKPVFHVGLFTITFLWRSLRSGDGSGIRGQLFEQCRKIQRHGSCSHPVLPGPCDSRLPDCRHTQSPRATLLDGLKLHHCYLPHFSKWRCGDHRWRLTSSAP